MPKLQELLIEQNLPSGIVSKEDLDFNFKTRPFKHQLGEWLTSRNLKYRALLHEQGTGKTKVILDTAAYLYATGEIDGVLIIAPNGVHENWVLDEIPTHLAINKYQSHSYRSKSARTKWHQSACRQLTDFDGLAFLAMSYDAFMTKQGRRTAEDFLHRRKVLFTADESQRIKSPSAKRTRAIVATGKRAPYRRILTGTPMTNKPFDYYTQIRFLNPEFWKENGFASYEAFKTYFGIWEQRINGQTGQRFNQVVAFKNLDHLQRILKPISTRVLKSEVLDLPPKLYQKRYFDITSEQRQLYDSLKSDFLAYLNSGEMVTAQLIIVRLLRLQQITCGYIPSDDCETINRFDENPRMKALLDLLEDVETKAIIWARFREDINQICEALGDEAVRYDGAVDERGRLNARRRFQEGDARWFVGNPAAAGVGLTLHAAQTVIYYSNSFNLEHRLQSEDRAHRIGQEHAVYYIDLQAQDTVDTHITQALMKKLDISSKITGDKIKEWL